jgi:hypothetical protein
VKGFVDDQLRALLRVPQIVASDGEYPLLGTMLLAGHRLDIDYESKTVELT